MAGACRIHCNLETSRSFFPTVCTTHTYDEKVETLLAAKRAGLSVCSGGIMGLGEACFASGTNAAISGDMLTTSGITVETDMALLDRLGYRVGLWEV